MRRIHILQAATAAVVITGALTNAQTRLQPGKYALTMEISRDGKPLPAMTIEECVTPEDAADFATLLGQSASAEDCTVSDLKTQSDKVTFKTSCKVDDEVYDSTVELRFATDSYTGLMTTTADGEVFSTKLSGKRLGACEKKQS